MTATLNPRAADRTGITFGSNVRRLREARNWSGRELARQAGLAQSTVYRCEAGEAPNLRSAVLLARVLGANLDEMVRPWGPPS